MPDTMPIGVLAIRDFAEVQRAVSVTPILQTRERMIEFAAALTEILRRERALAQESEMRGCDA